VRFIYVGNYRPHWSTEGYIANCLEQLGHPVHRLQDNLYTPEQAAARVREITRESRLSDPYQPVVLLFCKCELRGCSFRNTVNHPKRLLHFLSEVRTGQRGEGRGEEREKEGREREGVDLVACWMFDLIRKDFSPQRHYWAEKVSPCCDVFFSTDSGNVDDTTLQNQALLRQGYPGPGDVTRDLSRGELTDGYRCDVANLGSVYGYRSGWVRNLYTRFGDRFASFQSGIHGNALFDFCKSAGVVVGPPYPYYPGYWSNRLYLVTGYGGCLACPTVEGMEEEGWLPGTHYAALPLETNHAADVLEDLVKDEPLQNHLRENGQKLAFAKHRMIHRVADLVQYLEHLRRDKTP
jgi:hypothetical protein